MLYLNGEIAAAYWQGHWHYAAYLGNVLVWDGLHRKRGEARNVIVFAATAAGVTALAVPAAVAAQLRLLSSAEGKAMPFGVGQGDGALALKTSAEGKAVLVEKNLLYELLTLTSSGKAVPVAGGTSKAGEALTLTQNADGVGAAAVPDAGGENLTLTQSGEAIAAGTVPAEGGGEANFSGTGEGVSAAAGSGAGTEPLTLENSAAPVAATLGDATAALGLRLVNRAEGRAYAVGWEYPVQEEDGTLRVTQVYSALQESDGTLTIDAPISGKVIMEYDGIAWIIPDGTTKYYKSRSGWVIYAERNEVQYIVLENRNTQAVNVKMSGSVNVFVTAEAVAADAHPRGHITVNGVTVVTADGIAISEQGSNVQLSVSWGNFKSWQPNTQKVIGVYGGYYQGEYASTPVYPERTSLVINSIHTTEGS